MEKAGDPTNMQPVPLSLAKLRKPAQACAFVTGFCEFVNIGKERSREFCSPSRQPHYSSQRGEQPEIHGHILSRYLLSGETNEGDSLTRSPGASA